DTPTYLFTRGDEAKPDKSRSVPAAVPAFFEAKLAIEPVKLSPTAQFPEKQPFIVNESLVQSEQAVTGAREALAKLSRTSFPALPAVGNPLATAVRWWSAVEALTLADLDVRLAEARLAALRAVLQAERLEDARKANTPEWQHAAKQAAGAQLTAAVIVASRNLLLAG